MIYVPWRKGATSYEWQLGDVCISIVHLRSAPGNAWYTFFGRFKVRLAPNRQQWKWVHCGASAYCCYRGVRDGDSEFMGCQADVHNDWVAAKWYRSIVADVRLFYMERKKS